MLAAILTNLAVVQPHPGPDGAEEDYRILQLGIWRRRQLELALKRIRAEAPQPIIDKSLELGSYSIQRLSDEAKLAYEAEKDARIRAEVELDAIMADLARLQELRLLYLQWREDEALIALLMMV